MRDDQPVAGQCLAMDDLDAARRFLNDWGVAEVSADAAGADYRTKDGTEVKVTLPPHATRR